MRAFVFCVVIELVTASSRIDQNYYSNDENQIRRVKFSHYLPYIPKSSQNGQNRHKDDFNVRTLYPQKSDAFVYNLRPIIPYLIERVGTVFKNEKLVTMPFITGRRINRLVFKKIPNMLTQYVFPNRKLHRLLTKKLNYKLQNGAIFIGEIRNLIIKLLRSKDDDFFVNANKRHERDFLKFTTHRTKVPEYYEEVPQDLAGPLSFNDKLNALEISNQNKQTQNVAKAKSVKNIGVSGKNNQDNSKIVIKDLHVNIGGNVSNIANKSIIKNKEENPITNVTILKSSSISNNSNNYSEKTYNKGNMLIEEIRNLNKKNNNQTKSLSRDNLTFNTKDNTSLNLNHKPNTKHENQKALYNVKDYKKDFLAKNQKNFIKKGQQESIYQYNIRKNLGYHNLHQISQGTDGLEKSEYNNEPTNKIQASKNISEKIHPRKVIQNLTRHFKNFNKTVYQNTIATATQNLLTKQMNTVDQHKKRQFNKPLEFEIGELSAKRTPYHSQEIIASRKPSNKKKESSSSVKIERKLHSAKESHQKNLHLKKDKQTNKFMEVKNINKNIHHKMSNLQSIESNLLRNLMKPIEITKTVKESKTITFDNHLDRQKNKKKSNNSKNTNLSQENVLELFLLNENNNPIVKKVIEIERETSHQIKINNNSDKSDLMFVILYNIFLSNNKNCLNNNVNNNTCDNEHRTSLKSVKDHSDLSHGKEKTTDSKKDYSHYKGSNRYEAKNNILCRDCIQSGSSQKIIEPDSLLEKAQEKSKVQSTIFNENVKIKSKNIQNKSQAWNKIAAKTFPQNKNYNNKPVTGHRDVKRESLHVIRRKADFEEQDNTEEPSVAMTNKDKLISNILAPENVKNDKKLLPYWLPSDAQEVYDILQQPSKDAAVTDSLDLEIPLKEEIDKIVQLKNELGNANLEEIINLKINTVGIGKATNIIDKLVPSLYDIYLKNFITKILYRLRQILSNYESIQQKNELRNLNIHEIRKANSVISIFESARGVFNKPNDESLYDLLVSLLRFNKQSEEDFDEEAKVILDSVSREKLYGVLKYFLVPEPTLDAIRDFLKYQDLYPQYVYFQVLDNILPNIKIIIINGLAITDDKHDDINKNKETMDKLVKILLVLDKVLKDLGIPETTQRFIIEESILDIVKKLAHAYIENYEETVYVQFKKQLQDALYNNINV